MNYFYPSRTFVIVNLGVLCNFVRSRKYGGGESTTWSNKQVKKEVIGTAANFTGDSWFASKFPSVCADFFVYVQDSLTVLLSIWVSMLSVQGSFNEKKVIVI